MHTRARTLLGLVVLALVAALTVPVFAAGPAGAAPGDWFLYGGTGTNVGTSDLHRIDPATGAAIDTVGPIGFAVTGLAVDPTDGTVYGSTSNNSDNNPGSLITIDTATGAGTLVGSFDVGSQTSADLTFGPDGTLYGIIEAGDDDIVTIDKATGAATIIGEAGRSTYGSGIDFDVPGDRILWAGDGANGDLYDVDLNDGSTTVAATLDDATSDGVSAMATGCDGSRYGVLLDIGTKGSRLSTIDAATGAVSVIGPSVDRLDAITPACPLELETTPTFDRAEGQFDLAVLDDACQADTSVTLLDSDGDPVSGVTVDVDDPNNIGLSFGDNPGGSYAVVVECTPAGTAFGSGLAELQFARGTITKVVDGTAPAGSAFTITAACEDDGVGAPFDQEFDFGASGGSDLFVVYELTNCTVTETADGGADSTSQSAAAFTFPEPRDESITVTNVFGSGGQSPPATPVVAQPTFTG